MFVCFALLLFGVFFVVVVVVVVVCLFVCFSLVLFFFFFFFKFLTLNVHVLSVCYFVLFCICYVYS